MTISEEREETRVVGPSCEICGCGGLQPVSGGKYWCLSCGYLAS